jgi:flavin-dependent dehydrogenase
MMTQLSNGRRHAVVIGASVAGLATARVLAERFARVTVLERHAAPSGVVSIAPHGRYPHVLLEGGGLAAERLFPSFRDEALAAGAPTVDRDTVRWWSEGWRVKRRTDTGSRVLASRALIETIVRRCVEAIPNVRIEYGTTPDGLVFDGDRVVGVRLAASARLELRGDDRPRGAGDAGRDGAGRPPDEILDADLVVDCAGRGSRLVSWLEAAGFPAPPVSELDVDLCYLSITLERRPTDLGGAKALIVQNIAPEMTRLGLAVAVEGERWMVLLGGYFGDMPPSERAGYIAFAESLPVPELGSLLRASAAIGEPMPYRFKSSRRVHFERAARWPAGLVALGDATCSFNPLYGQGMSVAIMQAEHLGRALDQHGGVAGEALTTEHAAQVAARRLARSIQRELARITDLAWNIAAGGDLAYPQVAGKRTWFETMIRRYVAKVFRACSVDAAVVDALYDVTNLVAPPSRLLRPSIVARVLRAQRHWQEQQSRAAPQLATVRT